HIDHVGILKLQRLDRRHRCDDDGIRIRRHGACQKERNRSHSPSYRFHGTTPFLLISSFVYLMSPKLMSSLSVTAPMAAPAAPPRIAPVVGLPPVRAPP